jgi:glutamyl-tRNA synthetase
MSQSGNVLPPPYRGRLAPSPTGLLHLGHARTFWMASERARSAAGALVFRNEDLDPVRSKQGFVNAMFEDLRWFGIVWQEGPDLGGPFAPYNQSERCSLYLDALRKLADSGFIYPCTCSRKDISRAAQAPNQGDEEPIYPGTCRPPIGSRSPVSGFKSPRSLQQPEPRNPKPETRHVNWRFRVPDDEVVSFTDGHLGSQQFVAGKDFGDFIVWRHDDVPAYQLAVVVDDAAMKITEVVRGADLLVSTARQLLLYRALGLEAPAFFHCPLITDETGMRLAKRHDSLSLRALREQGASPESLRQQMALV